MSLSVLVLQIARLGFTCHSHYRIRKSLSRHHHTIINVINLSLTYCHRGVPVFQEMNWLGGALNSDLLFTKVLTSGLTLFNFQHQNSLQSLVDPTRNDVQLSSSDYQRFKKHSPKYTPDVSPAGVINNQ